MLQHIDITHTLCLFQLAPQSYEAQLSKSVNQTLQSYKCRCCRGHCSGVVVSLSTAETRPSIRAVQRCFVRSNSISGFLYRTHHISKQTRGQCALRWLHKAKEKRTENKAGRPGLFFRKSELEDEIQTNSTYMLLGCYSKCAPIMG